MLAAYRYDDLLALLELSPYKMWFDRQYGVKALAAQGKIDDAIRYAETRALNDSPRAIARTCEEILLSAGRVDEAYERYGLVANQAEVNATWFRAIMKKYPAKNPADILRDLVEWTPGEEGKWFAAAKDAGLFEEAIALANRTPCSPQTLIRAARDFQDTNPTFAMEAGMAALHWLAEGYGYDITGLDVSTAYTHTMQAAEKLGCADDTHRRIRELVAGEAPGKGFVSKILGPQLGLRR